MHIYFSGLGGVGIGPLAEIAHDAGYQVSGSDLSDNLMTKKLRETGIDVAIGQDGSQIASVHGRLPIDWFVHTAALPADHQELIFAHAHNIRISKRDELLAEIIRAKDLKLIAVSGTHGKTTTTGMFVWVFKQLGIPLSYSVGTTLSFGPSGAFDPASQYFIYECDEYDRNMLHFEPYISLITALDHDHVDTYPTEHDYRQAFITFIEQSGKTYLWEKDLRYLKHDLAADLEAYDELMDLSHLTLAGDHMRHNAFLVEKVLLGLLSILREPGVTGGGADRVPPSRNFTIDTKVSSEDSLADSHWLSAPENVSRALSRKFSGADHYLRGPHKSNTLLLWGTAAGPAEIISALNSFPGTDRRFEKLANNLYSDYGHHPAEIAATLQLAHELSDYVVLVYQPHQNTRQHDVREEYKNSMLLAEKVYWLPTYLTREDKSLEVLTPQQLISGLTNQDVAEPAELDEALWNTIQRQRDAGHLVLCMGAGTIDGWVRDKLLPC